MHRQARSGRHVLTDQERVAAIVARAREALAIGLAVIAAREGPCNCRYDDGEPRYTTPDGRLSHRCGR